MKTSNSVQAMFATMVIALVATGIMAQETKTKELPGSKVKSRVAIIAVRRDNKLEFVGGKSKLMRSMQQAFARVNEKEVVNDMDLRSFAKLNYLAVSLVDQRKGRSTLFFELEPDSGGTAFHTNGPHVVTCVNSGNCVGFCIIIPPYTAGNPDPSPHCDCAGGNTTGHRCDFKINKAYLSDLVASFNRDLLANGFELAPDGNAPSEGDPKDKKPPSSRRPIQKK